MTPVGLVDTQRSSANSTPARAFDRAIVELHPKQQGERHGT